MSVPCCTGRWLVCAKTIRPDFDLEISVKRRKLLPILRAVDVTALRKKARKMQNLLSVAQLGRLLGLSAQTIYNRRSTGEDMPPAIKIGSQVRFDPDEVKMWLKKRQEQPSIARVQPSGTAEVPRRRGRPTKAESMAQRGHAIH